MIQAIVRLLGSASSSRIDALARLVAQQSAESVSSLVGARVESMKLSEARGYVRARAASIVQRETRLAIGRYPGGDLAWTELVARKAVERIVPLVLRQTGVGVPKRVTARMAA